MRLKSDFVGVYERTRHVSIVSPASIHLWPIAHPESGDGLVQRQHHRYSRSFRHLCANLHFARHHARSPEKDAARKKER